MTLDPGDLAHLDRLIADEDATHQPDVEDEPF